MTTFELILHRQTAARMARVRTKRHEMESTDRNTLMKIFLLGMVCSISVWPVILGQMEPDAVIARDFTYSMIGGVLGSLICFCAWGYDANECQGDPGKKRYTFRHMAVDTLGNLVCGVTFGPSLSYVFADKTGFAFSQRMIIVVSAVCGIGGIALLRAAGPRLISMLSTALPEALFRAMGWQVPDKKDP